MCSLAWKCFGFPKDELESVTGVEDVWVSLLDWTINEQKKMNGQIDEKMDRFFYLKVYFVE